MPYHQTIVVLILPSIFKHPNLGYGQIAGKKLAVICNGDHTKQSCFRLWDNSNISRIGKPLISKMNTGSEKEKLRFNP
jgi:hypothetical protein